MEIFYLINIFKIYKEFYSFIPTYKNNNKYDKKSVTFFNAKYKLLLELVLLVLFLFILFSNNKKYNLILFRNFIKDCYNLKRYNNFRIINNQFPYISICIPAYNMEKYLEKAILSLISQTFQNFEIIIVNDNSNDNTQIIIKKLQKEFKGIKVINHNKNLGVYCSRIDATLNSNGKYILFIDPDDMILNPYLFEELFDYNLKYNLDMIEFSVFHKKENEKRIYRKLLNKHLLNHKKL